MIRFRTATVEIGKDSILATFKDGSANRFSFLGLGENEEYRDIARWAGYKEDWRRYAIDHELTHHWLADRLGWEWSWSLHDNPPQPWPAHVAWEEHLCNRLQRAAMTGAVDEFGVLQAVFGERLNDELIALSETWGRV